MERHITEGAAVEAKRPRGMAGMGADQILDHMRSNFKFEMQPDEAGRLRQVATNAETEYLQAVAAAIFNPENWKGAIYAKHADCGNEWVKAAIVWYHGAQPMESFAGVYSNGYACG